MNKLVVFLEEAWEEIKKTDWPKKDKVFRYVVFVVVLSLAVGVFLGFLDWAFSDMIKRLIF